MPTTSVIPLKGMAAESIDSDQYVDGSIDAIHLSANSVDSDAYVDASIDLAHMSSESVDEDNLLISNSGSNGEFLSKQSGDTGGLTWAAAGGGATAGIWTSITKTTISNVAEAWFTATDSSLYVDYMFVFRDLVNATDNVSLQMGFSIDGGSSSLYTSFGYTYDKKNLHTTPALATTGGENTFPRLTDEMSNTTGEGVSLQLLIFSPHVATTMTNFVWSGAHLADDGTKKGIQGWGLRAVAGNYDAYRFNTSSGNMTSGEIEMYGRTT